MTAPNGELDALELLPVAGECACPQRRGRLPLRMSRTAAELLRACTPDPEMPIQTFWCHTCKRIVVIRAKQLYLVA